MPVAVRRQGEPALRACKDRHARVERLAHHLGRGRYLAAEDLGHATAGTHLVAVVGQVGEEREGRADRSAAVDDGLQPVVVHV